MRLDAFLLADAASAHEGKLYIHGGGLTRIAAPFIPWTQPQLSVVLRLEVVDRDWEPGKEIALALIDPDGAAMLPPVSIPLPQEPPPAVAEGEEVYVQLVLGLGPIQFGQQGVHRLEVRVGNELLRSMTFPVIAVGPREPSGS